MPTSTFTINAVMTNAGLDAIVKQGVGLMTGWNPVYTKFKIGRGGWYDSGSGILKPRLPDPTLTDLDIITDAGRPSISKRYTTVTGSVLYYEKALVSGDLTHPSDLTQVVSCLLDTLEFNDADPPNNIAPDLYEIGVFAVAPDLSDLMMLYATFEKRTKTSLLILDSKLQLTVGNG